MNNRDTHLDSWRVNNLRRYLLHGYFSTNREQRISLGDLEGTASF